MDILYIVAYVIAAIFLMGFGIGALAYPNENDYIAIKPTHIKSVWLKHALSALGTVLLWGIGGWLIIGIFAAPALVLIWCFKWPIVEAIISSIVFCSAGMLGLCLIGGIISFIWLCASNLFKKKTRDN